MRGSSTRSSRRSVQLRSTTAGGGCRCGGCCGSTRSGRPRSIARKRRQQLLEQHPHLEARQVRAEAEVDAVAEAEVRVRIAARCRTSSSARTRARRGSPSPPRRRPCRPARCVRPPSCARRVAVRRFDGDGVVQRSISSMAPRQQRRVRAQRRAADRDARSARAARRRSRCASSRSRPRTAGEEHVQLAVRERSAGRRRRACVHDDRQHVVGRVRALLGDQRRRRTRACAPASAASGGVSAAVAAAEVEAGLDRARTARGGPLSGTPSRMQIICIGSSAATSTRKSIGTPSSTRVEQRARRGGAARPRGAARSAA